jgi:isopentenyl phosphate kinase
LSKPLILIKLGGAALTDKGRIYSPRSEVIRSAARQVAAIQSRFSVFVVHGAGSYGHIPVKQFGLYRGFDNVSQLIALSEAKLRLLEWELTLSRVFKQYKVPVVPFIPADYLIAQDGRIHSCNTTGIEEWMRLGCVPSTGGDIVPDISTGFSIVSGDQLAVYMAISLHASRLVFATDVDGIFDSNPKQNKAARLLRRVHVADLRKISTNASPNITDVTGGMKGKLQEVSKAASSGVPVFFVNLTKGNRLRDLAFDRKPIICSEVVSD